MAIEHNFDTAFIAAQALKEKQIQQNYRPLIAVHKWFARRPGTLFRGLVLAEFGNEPLAHAFFSAHDFAERVIADPFMGGGTPLLEANRVGCDVIGLDINPMAAWIVREEIAHLDLAAYAAAAQALMARLAGEIGSYYRTTCPHYGTANVPVKYFLWVKVMDCAGCGQPFDLFPGYVVAHNKRHLRHVLVCAACGELNEVNGLDAPGCCQECQAALRVVGPAKRNRCACPHCGQVNTYPHPEAGPPRHRLFAIEYYNPHHKAKHRGRFFKQPDAADLAKVEAARAHWHRLDALFVPPEAILPGDETDRLHRWGYTHYRDLFHPRQLLGLELSCRAIAQVADTRIRHALATNLSDLLRYQNMLCRYDTVALKSLDIFSIHGFPVGLVQCESNVLGIPNGNGSSVGSGGWSNIVDKYSKAKRYCETPFEVMRQGTKKVQVPIRGEWIGERSNGARPRSVTLLCQDAATMALPAQSLDAVFTDPPYFGNVQYGELMDFCYVWLRRLVGRNAPGFDQASTRAPSELTGNMTQSRGLAHFTAGLAAVYGAMARALKPGAPLVFTYHHNKLEAYFAIGVAILDAGLTCSASLPCPAEMGGSIHIHGTTSSIVDTVFVCRAHGAVPRRWLAEQPAVLAPIVAEDLAQLRAAGVKPTQGDLLCIIYGHLTRMAIWNLRPHWDTDPAVQTKLDRFAEAIAALGDLQEIIEQVHAIPPRTVHTGGLFSAATLERGDEDAVPF